jgi:hypothetical protein
MNRLGQKYGSHGFLISGSSVQSRTVLEEEDSVILNINTLDKKAVYSLKLDLSSQSPIVGEGEGDKLEKPTDFRTQNPIYTPLVRGTLPVGEYEIVDFSLSDDGSCQISNTSAIVKFTSQYLVFTFPNEHECSDVARPVLIARHQFVYILRSAIEKVESQLSKIVVIRLFNRKKNIQHFVSFAFKEESARDAFISENKQKLDQKLDTVKPSKMELIHEAIITVLEKKQKINLKLRANVNIADVSHSIFFYPIGLEDLQEEQEGEETRKVTVVQSNLTEQVEGSGERQQVFESGPGIEAMNLADRKQDDQSDARGLIFENDQNDQDTNQIDVEYLLDDIVGTTDEGYVINLDDIRKFSINKNMDVELDVEGYTFQFNFPVYHKMIGDIEDAMFENINKAYEEYRKALLKSTLQAKLTIIEEDIEIDLDVRVKFESKTVRDENQVKVSIDDDQQLPDGFDKLMLLFGEKDGDGLVYLMSTKLVGKVIVSNYGNHKDKAAFIYMREGSREVIFIFKFDTRELLNGFITNHFVKLVEHIVESNRRKGNCTLF